MSQNLVEEIICYVFTIGYCVATESIKNSSFSIAENMNTGITYQGVVGKTLSQSFNRKSRSNTSMKVLDRKIVADPGFRTPIAAFVKQHLINAVKEGLKREPQFTREIPSSIDRFPSASTRAKLNKASNARSPCRKHCDRKDRKYRDSLEAPREKTQTSSAFTVMF